MAKAGQCSQAVGVVRMGEGFGIRTRRENISSVRSLLLPETAYVECANFDEDEDLFTISHLPQMTRDDLDQALHQAGWKARAIRPQGIDRWTVASKQNPEAAHMIINGCLTIIERHVPKVVSTHTVSVVAREVKVDSVMDPVTNTTTTTSRIAEIQTHMQTQLEQVIDGKLQQAHARIESLNQALVTMQNENVKLHEQMASDVTQLRDEQAFARQKLHEVETSVAASNNAVISQMGEMFASMQASLEQTLIQKLNPDPDKRARLDEPSKTDPFSVKS